MNSTDMHIIHKGREKMSHSSVAVCSIVRDCNKALKHNIHTIEQLRSYFRQSLVIVFENDSKDGTKETLLKWKESSDGIDATIEDLHVQTIVKHPESEVNRYYSFHRIEKMSAYRNKYLHRLEKLGMTFDFVMIVDLDIEHLSIEGICHSFGLSEHWDVITANGYSLSPSGSRRYHDAYALVELGTEELPQTEYSIASNQKKFKYLKSGMPLVPVYSAHGGLSIMKGEVLKGVRYRAETNKDEKVESRCEHFALCKEIRNNGHSRIFINPSMELNYQSFNLTIASKYLRKRILRQKD